MACSYTALTYEAAYYGTAAADQMFADGRLEIQGLFENLGLAYWYKIVDVHPANINPNDRSETNAILYTKNHSRT